jgi:hypothetical protein
MNIAVKEEQDNQKRGLGLQLKSKPTKFKWFLSPP